MPENSNTELRPNTAQILRHLEEFRKRIWGNTIQKDSIQFIEQIPQQTTIVEPSPIVTPIEQKSINKIKTNKNGDVRFHPYGINIGKIEWTQNGGNI